MAGKYLFDVKNCCSMFCIDLSYFAYLRSVENMLSNNRLFFGVEEKTQKEKSWNT